MKHYNLTTTKTLWYDDIMKQVVRVVRLVVRTKSIDKDIIYNILTTLTTISSVLILQSIFQALNKIIKWYQICRKSRNKLRNHNSLPRNSLTTDLTSLRLENIYVTEFITGGRA